MAGLCTKTRTILPKILKKMLTRIRKYMSKQSVAILFFAFTVQLQLLGQQIGYYSFSTLETEEQPYYNANAAFLQLTDSASCPTLLYTSYNGAAGNFKPYYSGSEKYEFLTGAKAYKKIKKTNLYGEIQYSNAADKGVNYTNVNDPETVYPYTMPDTIGNDTYSREFFTFRGLLSHQQTELFTWATDINYTTGVAAQDRDPRSLNKVIKLKASPGVLFRTKAFSLGANYTFKYYNEDIDVDVVEANSYYTLFQHHGLGNTTYHSASSFYRLYKKFTHRAGLQCKVNFGNFSSLTNLSFASSELMVYDGRKASNANWAYRKTDAQSDADKISIEQLFRKENRQVTNLLQVNYSFSSTVGSEYIQKLEQEGETDLEQWHTYAVEEKYNEEEQTAALHFIRIEKDSNRQFKSTIELQLIYEQYEEKYYIPDGYLRYKNIYAEAKYCKAFSLCKNNASISINGGYKYSISADDLLPDNTIVDLIIEPYFIYRTTNYYFGGAEFLYEFSIQKMPGRYYIKCNGKYIESVENENFISYGIRLGMNF